MSATAQRSPERRTPRPVEIVPPADPPFTRTGAYTLIAEVAGMLRLLGATLVGIVRWPPSWPREFVEQYWTLALRCVIPVALVVGGFQFGATTVQGGQIDRLLGSIDRMGVQGVTVSVREICPFLTAMVVAGVAGTAVCADLGARKIRQELAAMEVIGVDPVRSLVVPRFLAMVVLTPLLSMVGVVSAVATIALGSMYLYHGTLAGFEATFTNNFALAELIGSVIKTTLLGVIVATVCCYKGLNVKGGPMGVGRAVNQAVVICFVLIFIVNYTFNSVLLAAYPQLQGLR
jgi:phospholipid/cholesterol/gamma-HCH transport system permease protein